MNCIDVLCHAIVLTCLYFTIKIHKIEYKIGADDLQSNCVKSDQQLFDTREMYNLCKTKIRPNLLFTSSLFNCSDTVLSEIEAINGQILFKDSHHLMS